MDDEKRNPPLIRAKKYPEATAKITKMWNDGKDKTEIAKELHAITPGLDSEPIVEDLVEDAIDSLIGDGVLTLRQEQLDTIQKFLKKSNNWETIPDISSNTSLGRGAIKFGLRQLAQQGQVVRAPGIDSKTGSPMFKSTEKLGLRSQILGALTDRVVR